MQNQSVSTRSASLFEIKAQARRLREALQELQVSVTHSVALNLIARSQGHRNWEALESQSATQVGAPRVTPVALDAAKLERNAWLTWLEACLRIRGFIEEDLDDLAYESHGEKEASEINNQGMWDQLRYRFNWHFAEKQRTVQEVVALVLADLQELLCVRFDFPGADGASPMIPMQVRDAAGSVRHFETVDALEWFAQADADAIARLLVQGLSGSKASNEVGAYLAQHSLFPALRARVQGFLSVVEGVTYDIEKEAVQRFVRVQRAAGGEFSDEVLRTLGLQSR